MNQEFVTQNQPLLSIERAIAASETPGCATPETLQRYTFGELGWLAKKKLQSHLRVCPFCLSRLNRIWGEGARARSAGRRMLRRMQWSALSAATVCVLVVMFGAPSLMRSQITDAGEVNGVQSKGGTMTSPTKENFTVTAIAVQATDSDDKLKQTIDNLEAMNAQEGLSRTDRLRNYNLMALANALLFSRTGNPTYDAEAKLAQREMMKLQDEPAAPNKRSR